MEEHFGETVYFHFQGSCLIPNLIEFIPLCLNMETKHLYTTQLCFVQLLHVSVISLYEKIERKLKV